jgi:hypothetical protein
LQHELGIRAIHLREVKQLGLEWAGPHQTCRFIRAHAYNDDRQEDLAVITKEEKQQDTMTKSCTL